VEDYILFVDTETTGFPTDWRKAYSSDSSWPHTAQVAWVLYDKNGVYIKGENHYLRIPPNSMKASAMAIHGISQQYLNDKGEAPLEPLKRLASDLKIYKPLVVGHYVRLDFHMLGADFYRVGLANPLPKLHTFCTMQSLAPQQTGEELRYQRLGEVYQRLFLTTMERQHDAWIDANATAKVFFELLRRQEITQHTIEKYPQLSSPKKSSVFTRYAVPFVLTALGGLLLLVLRWVYGK
jgi:DNA polymerase-3 subunit epsilon